MKTKELLKKLQSDKLQRSFSVDRAALDEESRTVEMSFSSELPYQRWFGMEILGHKDGEVDMGFIASGNAPLLVNHKQDEIPVAVIEKAWIDSDRKGRALVRFGRNSRANEVFADVQDGILRNVSVGYQVNKMDLVSSDEKSGDTFRVTSWTPLEASLVSVPADQSVGVGRSTETIIKEEITMQEEKKAEKVDVAAIQEKARKDAMKAETARVGDILTIGRIHKMESEAAKAVENNMTVDAFRAQVLASVEEKANAVEEVADSNKLDMSEKEVKRYSMFKLFRAMATNDWKDAGFERECSQAFEDKTGRRAKGAFIPPDVLMSGNFAKRDLSTGIGTAGGYLVSEDLQPQSFIEMLRNSTSVIKLGARVLTGLEGDIDIPKQTGGATAYWVNEGGTLTESQQTLGQIRMTPKTVGCYTDITRRMMLQSSVDVENFVRSDFAQQMAIAIDLAAINGTGASGEPRGILKTTGIGSVTLNAANAPDWGDIVDLETALATDNALKGSLGYVTTATIAGAMKQAVKDSGSGQFLLEGDMTNGYKLEVSNNVPVKHIIFGNFADMIIGMWSGLDVTVDTNTLGTSGGTRIICFQDLDVAIRHAESFADGYKA